MSNKDLSLGQALSALARDLPALLSAQEILAQLQRERYLALIKQGFTEQQALELAAKVSFHL